LGHPLGWFIAGKAGGKGDLLNNLNPAAPSFSMFDKNALTISSVAALYPTDVLCQLAVQDLFGCSL
jgi:hypothetical protein